MMENFDKTVDEVNQAEIDECEKVIKKETIKPYSYMEQIRSGMGG